METKFRENGPIRTPQGECATVMKIFDDGRRYPVVLSSAEPLGFLFWYDINGRWKDRVILTENEYSCKVRIRSIKLKQ